MNAPESGSRGAFGEDERETEDIDGGTCVPVKVVFHCMTVTQL